MEPAAPIAGRAVGTDQRSVVLYEPLKGFPGEVETIEVGIPAFQARYHRERLGIVIEAAVVREAAIEGVLAGVSERRMAEIVRECTGLCEILIKAKGARERPRDLGDLKRMGEPGSIVIALVVHEDLSLVGEPAKRRRMDDAVAIAAEIASCCAWRLVSEAAAAPRRIGCIGRAPHSHTDRHLGTFSLTAVWSAHNYRTNTLATAGTIMATSVVLTERAARRIGQILKGEPPGSMLRVSVEGGGCSGFQYKFDFTTDKDDADLVLARDGATVLVDPVSVQYMAGAEIDFVDDLIGASFKINNPVATSSCGCGTSFSV